MSESIVRFKVETNHVLYGGPSSKEGWRTKHRNLSIGEAIKEVRDSLGDVECDVEIGRIFKGREDSMGCYTLFVITPDNSVDTIFENLSPKERVELFTYAENWMLNEMVEIPSLVKRIEGFEGVPK